MASARPCPRDATGHPRVASSGHSGVGASPPLPTRCCWSGVGQSLPGPSTEPLRRPGGFVLALGPAGPGSAPHGSLALCGAAGSPLQAGFAPCLPPRQRKRLRWGNRTEGRPLTHGLFTRRACESYSEKCVTVRHRACAETWGRHGARRGGEGTRELWAEPRGAAAPRPRSRCSSRPRASLGGAGLGGAARPSRGCLEHPPLHPHGVAVGSSVGLGSLLCPPLATAARAGRPPAGALGLAPGPPGPPRLGRAAPHHPGLLPPAPPAPAPLRGSGSHVGNEIVL